MNTLISILINAAQAFNDPSKPLYYVVGSAFLAAIIIAVVVYVLVTRKRDKNAGEQNSELISDAEIKDTAAPDEEKEKFEADINPEESERSDKPEEKEPEKQEEEAEKAEEVKEEEKKEAEEPEAIKEEKSEESDKPDGKEPEEVKEQAEPSEKKEEEKQEESDKAEVKKTAPKKAAKPKAEKSEPENKEKEQAATKDEAEETAPKKSAPKKAATAKSGVKPETSDKPEAKKPAPKKTTGAKKPEPKKSVKPFIDRLIAEPSVHGLYNEIKNTALSYPGIKAKLDRDGEKFIFGTETKAQLALDGKSLELALSVDPKTLPPQFEVETVDGALPTLCKVEENNIDEVCKLITFAMNVAMLTRNEKRRRVDYVQNAINAQNRAKQK